MATVRFRVINSINGDVYYDRERDYNNSEYATRIYLGDTVSGGDSFFCVLITAYLDNKSYTFTTSTDAIPTDPVISGEKYHITGGYFTNDGNLYNLDLSHYPHISNTSIDGTFYGDIDIYLTYAKTTTTVVTCLLNDHVNDMQQIGIEEFDYTNSCLLSSLSISSYTYDNDHYDYIASGSLLVDDYNTLFNFFNEIPETFNGHAFTGVKLYVDGVIKISDTFNYGVNTHISPDDPFSGNMFNIYIEYAIDNDGYYTFRKYNGESITHFDGVGYISHYTLTVNDKHKDLIITVTSYDNDNNEWKTEEYNISWESDPGDDYIFKGLADNTGKLVFVPGEFDVNIYGDYEFIEVWEGQILPSDGFTLNLYHNASDPKVVEKNLEGVLDITGALKESCSILDPVIMIQTDQFDDLMKCNYCYIEKFKRYYYINNIEIYRTDLYILHLHVDVLMTYKDMIEFSSAFIVRTCGDKINMNIQDPLIVCGSDEEVIIRKVGAGTAPYYETGSIVYPTGSDITDPNYCWILTVLGE